MSASHSLGPLFEERPTNFRQVAFEAFHRANPHVYELLAAKAREAQAAGQRVGMRCIWEQIRWDQAIRIKHQLGAPKLNDWLAPYYSRLLMKQEPDLAGFFETRGGE